ARHLRRVRPQLAIRPLPFALRGGGATELLWPTTSDDDAVCRFLRDQIRAIAREEAPGAVRGSRTHIARAGGARPRAR
ncbi:MAG TPA: hypothetical protein VFP84_39370, partial [Kofleriaceae bacterium]|nr:hypothetical protein [Kofleriaceae bacterium]